MRGDTIDQPAQSHGVFPAPLGIVDRARPHNEQKPWIVVEENVANVPSSLGHELGLAFRAGNLVQHQGWSWQRDVRRNVEVRYLPHGWRTFLSQKRVARDW